MDRCNSKSRAAEVVMGRSYFKPKIQYQWTYKLTAWHLRERWPEETGRELQETDKTGRIWKRFTFRHG